MFSSMSAMGPCFISPAAYPSAWMYEISFSLRAPSSATGYCGPRPRKSRSRAAENRTGVRVEHVVRLARDGRSDHVADRQTARAPRLRLAEAAQRVGRLAALRDRDAERARVNERIAVAELAGEIHLDGDPGQRL